MALEVLEALLLPLLYTEAVADTIALSQGALSIVSLAVDRRSHACY